jgi:hypothetical protein
MNNERKLTVVWMAIAAAEAVLILCFGVGQMISGF